MRAKLEQQLKEIQEEVLSAKTLQQKTGSLKEAGSELGQLNALIYNIEREESAASISKSLLLKYQREIELEEIELELATLEKELQDHGDIDVRQVYSALAEKQQEQKSILTQIGQAEEDVKEAQKQLDSVQTELNKAFMRLPGENRLITTLELTQAARLVALELVEELIKLRQSSIENHLTRVFRSITNKKKEYDRIELGSDYAPKVITNSGKVVENNQLSAGEKEVLAFSFIAGLNLSIEAGAPLVMDTPFGHLDIRHREGLIKALPHLPCQVILLATDRDIPLEELEGLKPSLAGQFNIVRDEFEELSYIEKVG